MGLLVSQEKNYVSIFIKPTVDLTAGLTPSEKGVVAAVGKLSYGHPYYGVVLNKATQKLKTTNVNAGGSIDNELAFHIADYFSGYKGKMIVGRVLGVDSTTKVLEVKKDADSGDIYLDNATDVNVFGSNNIKDWEDTASTEMFEMVINSCLSEKASVSILNVNDYITVSIFDEFGNTIYKVEGGAKFDSLDDSGTPNYIGNICDNKIVTIKVDTTHDDYTSNFDITKVFEAGGLLADSGDKNYANAFTVITNNIEKCDYAISAGLRDVAALQTFRGITNEAKVPFIVDIYATSLQAAKDFKTSLNMNVEDVMFIWNRGKDLFKDFGAINVGLSGFIVGQAVRRNLSKLVGDVEFRMEGIAGGDYPVPRVKAEDLAVLTDAEKTDLVDSRINTVVLNQKGVLVVGDVLSANPKEQATKLFNVVESKYFIDRYIARIIATKLFKNLTEAELFVKEEVRLLFSRCQKNSYFDLNAEPPYSYNVYTKDNDTVVVDYTFVNNGITRRGVVGGTIVKKIEG